MIPHQLTTESRQAARLVAAAVFCIYLATAGGGLTSIDAVMTYEVTRSLVLHGTTAFDVRGLNQHPGVDGRYYSRFGIGQSIYNIPFYVAGRAAHQVLGLRIGRSDSLEKAAVSLGSAVAAAGIVWVAYLFAFRLSGSAAGARRTALALALGTLVWPYSKFGFNVALTGWCLTAAIYSAWVGVRLDRLQVLGASGAWLAGAFLTRHEMAIAAVLVVAWVLFESRHAWRLLASRLIWLAVPLAAALAIWLWYNFIRFGSPLDPGNLDDPVVGFDAPILVGLRGFLFSPGRSLFIYVPLAAAGVLALFALARRDRSLAVLFVSVCASLVVMYCTLRAWDGLRSYGPRYLVPLVPMLIIPLVWWLQPGKELWRRALVGLVVVSSLVQLPGVLVDFSKVSVEHARKVGEYGREAKIYNWLESGLVLDVEAAVARVPQNVRDLVRGRRPPGIQQAASEDDPEFGQRLAFSLDFWWLYLYYLAVIPAPVAVLIPIVLLALAFLSLRRSLALDASRDGPAAASVASAGP
jgi:hypothetical protein